MKKNALWLLAAALCAPAARASTGREKLSARPETALAHFGLAVDQELTAALFAPGSNPELVELAAGPEVQIFLGRARETLGTEPSHAPNAVFRFTAPDPLIRDTGGPSAVELVHALRNALAGQKPSDIREVPLETLDDVAKAVFDKAAMSRAVPIRPVPLEHSTPAEGASLQERLARTPEGELTPGTLARAILSEFDVLLIGEDHHSLSSIPLAYSLLPALRAEDASLGLENVHDIKGGGKVEYRMGDRERTEQFLSLMQGAVNNDVPFVGLDLSEETLRRRYRRAIEREARPMDIVYGVVEHLRNRFMSRRLALSMKGKAVGLAGNLHIETSPQLTVARPAELGELHYQTLADALRARGLRPFSLLLTGGRLVTGFDPEGLLQKLKVFYERALLGNREGRMIFRRTSADTGILHLGGTPFRTEPIR